MGKIFELNNEAIGFDTVEECIDLCRYYLDHDKERRLIAANGWRRVVTDYNEISVFRRKIDLIQKYMKEANSNSKNQKIILRERMNSKNGILYFVGYPFMRILYFARLARRILRMGMRIILLNIID